MIKILNDIAASLHTGGVTSSILVSPTIQSGQTDAVSALGEIPAVPGG